MRLFKQQRKISFNWKYILGEVLLLFFGITLAIWFNNWNAATKSRKDQAVAIQRIEEEIRDNLKQLTDARAENKAILLALQDYFGKPDGLVLLPAQLNKLQRKHANFVLVTDSAAAGGGKYRYTVEANLSLELPELTRIAWETTQTIGIAKEFNYDCLYQIEKTYNLQRLFQREIDKVVDALQRKEMNELTIVLSFSEQFGRSLEEYYQKALEKMENCR